MFGIHGDDLSAEITNLLTELNSSKMALWKQMRVVEIVATEIAENLGKDGTQFEMEPDRVIWPDGTITKKPVPSRSKRGSKKVAPAASKHGVYGVMVAQYGGGKKSSESPSTSAATGSAVQASSSSPVVIQANSEKAEQTKPKTVRCGKFFKTLEQVNFDPY